MPRLLKSPSMQDLDDKPQDVKASSPIVSIPKVLKNNQLLPNNKLLDTSLINEIIELLEGKPDGYYSKKDLIFEKIYKKKQVDGKDTYVTRVTNEQAYSIIKENGCYYAINLGEKHGALLGKGGQGKVKLGQRLSDGEFVAIKIMKVKKDHDYPDNINRLVNTTRLLQRLKRLPSYPAEAKDQKYYVVKIDQENKASDAKEKPFEKIAQIMKLESGMTARQFFKEKKYQLTESELTNSFVEMAKAVKDFMKSGFLHRDIKLWNFILNPETKQFTLIDVDYAHEMKNGLVKDKFEVGTKNYRATLECVDHQYIYSEQTEIYSLGYTFKRALQLSDTLKVVSRETIDLINLMLTPPLNIPLSENGNHSRSHVPSTDLDYIIAVFKAISYRELFRQYAARQKKFDTFHQLFKELRSEIPLDILSPIILDDLCCHYIQSQFIKNAAQGNLEQLKKLAITFELNDKIRNHQNRFGGTAVICAAYRGHLSTLKWLLENGFNCHSRDMQDYDYLENLSLCILNLAKQGHYDRIADIFKEYPYLSLEVKSSTEEIAQDVLIQQYAAYIASGDTLKADALKSALPSLIFNQTILPYSKAYFDQKDIPSSVFASISGFASRDSKRDTGPILRLLKHLKCAFTDEKNIEFWTKQVAYEKLGGGSDLNGKKVPQLVKEIYCLLTKFPEIYDFEVEARSALKAIQRRTSNNLKKHTGFFSLAQKPLTKKIYTILATLSIDAINEDNVYILSGIPGLEFPTDHHSKVLKPR